MQTDVTIIQTADTTRQTVRSERGFTLIELLVVILIIGILAAIAIPSFLNQKNKAGDASAKELARTAQTTAETLGTNDTDNTPYSALTSPASLVALEPTIVTTAGNGAYLSAAANTGSGTGYVVTATASDGNTFSITKLSTGVVTRSCTVVAGGNPGGCINDTW